MEDEYVKRIGVATAIYRTHNEHARQELIASWERHTPAQEYDFIANLAFTVHDLVIDPKFHGITRGDVTKLKAWLLALSRVQHVHGSYLDEPVAERV